MHKLKPGSILLFSKMILNGGRFVSFRKKDKNNAGVYRVDIVLNQTIVDTRNVNFVEITPE